MTELNLVQAVNAALRAEMRRDERVVILGEDVGKLGGVFRATRGLYEEFGQARVIDTPLAENGIIGAAIGMALHGLRPVAEIQFSDFIYPAFDQIVSEAAKYRYRSGGQFAVPMVIRAPIGGGVAGGMYHSQSPEALFIHTPGLKVVCPSTPYDAKGLLISAMRDEDPVLFFEPKRLYRGRPMPVPGEDYTIPLGRARVVRPGRDVTLVAWGAMVVEAFETAEELAPLGVDCEVIDLRTLWPLDLVSLEQSTKKTGRLLVVHEAPLTCGFGAELVALLSQRCFDYLRAPPERVTGWDIPFGYARELDYL
ncbi:MAG TPA: alpha-ketoacid dehydrogenase subunit beta, partial [Polyangiaceae bacterium]|nr:alpha-ketoacid dehydrogenase subunit beta [Polyangiaceae bacterium]